MPNVDLSLSTQGLWIKIQPGNAKLFPVPYSTKVLNRLFSLRNPFRSILNLVVKFSSFKSFPIPSYEPARTRRIVPGPGTRTGSTLLFSTTARFCDIKQIRNCSLLTSSSIAITRKTIGSLGRRVFNEIHNRGQILYGSRNFRFL